MNGNISIVIGSWGSYNECNERALGSKWLDLSDYSDWDEIVEELGENWDDDIYLYSGYDWDDYGRERLNDCGYEIPEFLEDYIDFDKYGRACGDCYVHEYSDGLIEIL